MMNARGAAMRKDNLKCPACGMSLIVSMISRRILTTCNHTEAQRRANAYNRTIEKENRDAETRKTEIRELSENDFNESGNI